MPSSTDGPTKVGTHVPEFGIPILDELMAEVDVDPFTLADDIQTALERSQPQFLAELLATSDSQVTERREGS